MPEDREERILVGVIAGAHGVRGQVRIRSFTADPKGVAAYGPVFDETGRRSLKLTVVGATKGSVIARVEGVEDRNAAEALKGLRLYVPRSALPEPEDDEYYHADLIGLAVELPGGEPFGRIAAVQNYGAGDVLEIQPQTGGPTVVVPFTRAVVPVVDIPGGRIVLEPPPGLLDEPPAPGPREVSE